MSQWEEEFPDDEMHTASENLTSDSKESATEPPLADEGQKSELAAEKEDENVTDKNDKSDTTGDGDEPGALEVEQEVEQSPEVEDEPGAIVMKKNSEDSLAEEKLETPSEKANSVRNDLQANKVDDAPANTDSEPSSDNVIPSKHKIPSQPLGKPTFLQEKIDNRIPTSDDIINEQEFRLRAELEQLLKDIRRLGEEGSPEVTFGELFDDDDVANYYEALVGTLKSAKKRGLIHFKGQMLLKGPNDKVVISIKTA